MKGRSREEEDFIESQPVNETMRKDEGGCDIAQNNP